MKIKNSFLSLLISTSVVNAIGMGLGFCSHITLVHLLSPSSYGLYSFIFSIAVIIGMLAGCGLPVAAQRIIPSMTIQAPNRLKYFIAFSQKLTLGWGVITSTLCFIFLYTYHFNKLDSQDGLSYFLGIALAIFLGLLRLHVGFFKALKKSSLGICYDTVFREIALLLIIWGGYLIGFKFTQAWHIVLIYVIILPILLIISFFQLKEVGSIRKSKYIRSEIQSWLKISLPILMLIVAQVLLVRLGVIMLSFVTTMEQVGVYSFAAKISQACSIIFVAGTTVFAPRAAELYRKKNIQALKSLYGRIQIFMTIGTACICVILGFLFPLLIKNLGDVYNQGFIPFIVLLIGYFVNAVLGPSNYLMIMTRHEVLIMWVTVMVMILCLFLNWILIPLMGMTGAAMATVLALNVRNFIGYIVFRTDKTLKI